MKQKTNWTRDRAQVTVAGALALMVWCGASHAGQKLPAKVPSPFREASFERDWQRTARVVDVKGGVLILPGTLHKQRLAAFRDEQPFTDVRLTAEFLVHRRGAPGHSFGIAFGSTDSQTYPALQVERQKVSLVRVAGGKTAAVLASKAIKDDEGKTRRLHLTQREGHVEVSYGPKIRPE